MTTLSMPLKKEVKHKNYNAEETIKLQQGIAMERFCTMEDKLITIRVMFLSQQQSTTSNNLSYRMIDSLNWKESFMHSNNPGYKMTESLHTKQISMQ